MITIKPDCDRPRFTAEKQFLSKLVKAEYSAGSNRPSLPSINLRVAAAVTRRRNIRPERSLTAALNFSQNVVFVEMFRKVVDRHSIFLTSDFRLLFSVLCILYSIAEQSHG